MCTSRLYRVTGLDQAGSAWADDLFGARHRLSLLAYDGPAPAVGDWIVAHSGYALGPADAHEAEEVAAEASAAREEQERR
ncbi:MAG TPA: hypothetical protein VFP54_06810 [Acidimicrobiales bacterium]|nr:hypothetical protein [Acidimicrobiales bacterium]